MYETTSTSRNFHLSVFDIQKAITDAVGRHELTHAELTAILAAQVVQWNKYAIRDEREESST